MKRAIKKELERDFEKVEARKYNQVSIRLRITDEKFRGLSYDQRERLVHHSLARLPPDVQSYVTMLIMVAPGERINPLLSYEFDIPSPDRL